MSQKRYKPEEIIHKLRVAEVEPSKGHNTGQICRKLGITEQTYYRWRKQYGGMVVTQLKELKRPQKEILDTLEVKSPSFMMFISLKYDPIQRLNLMLSTCA